MTRVFSVGLPGLPPRLGGGGGGPPFHIRRTGVLVGNFENNPLKVLSCGCGMNFLLPPQRYQIMGFN